MDWRSKASLPAAAAASGSLQDKPSFLYVWAGKGKLSGAEKDDTLFLHDLGSTLFQDGQVGQDGHHLTEECSG